MNGREYQLNKIYTGDVVEILENGDAIIQLPDEMLNDLKWYEGDVLDISVVDGEVYIKNLTKDEDR
jgi:bifunctional DNA-binding transcriptional regulator/antitoxin component of YhaV-PrlF toxin-antitoxin module